MNRDVIISINGLHLTDGEFSEPVEVFAPGEHYMEEGNHCLVYDQPGDGFEEEPVHTRLKFDESSLEILKTGGVETQMLIEKDRRTVTYYTTPFGSMDVGISTAEVALTEEENLLDIRAEYALDINGQFIGDCTVHIIARPKGSEINL